MFVGSDITVSKHLDCRVWTEALLDSTLRSFGIRHDYKIWDVFIRRA